MRHSTVFGLVARTGTIVVGPDVQAPVPGPMPLALADVPVLNADIAAPVAGTQDSAAAYRAYAKAAGVPADAASDPEAGLWRSETGGRILLLGLSQSLPAGCAFSDALCETVEGWGTGPMLVRLRLDTERALAWELVKEE